MARAVETDPERFLARYANLPQSFGGRYVCSDLFKETFAPYRESPQSRGRYNAPVHNAAAVLASEQLRRLLVAGEPERDTVLLVTGIPGAGKTSAVLDGGEIPGHVRAVYEGQLADSATALAKVRQILEQGLKPVIYAIHTTPERALRNTLQRFTEMGRGASIETMAKIQGGLTQGLRRIQEQHGDTVALRIEDRRDFQHPTSLDGWSHLPVLESEGGYEHIRARLSAELERQRSAGLHDHAYHQALGREGRLPHPELSRTAPGGDEAHERRDRAQESRQEALLSAPHPEAAPNALDRLRRKADERALELAAEDPQVRPSLEDIGRQVEQERAAHNERQRQREVENEAERSSRDQDQDNGFEL